MHNKWIISERTNEDLILDILEKRGIKDPESFLNPDYNKHRHDPKLLPNINEALSIIIESVRNKNIIGIFGDYDADGIPGTALLHRGLTKIGLEVVIFIPKREDGYGLSLAGIDMLFQSSANILITVDNGTTAFEEVDYAISKGMQVIIFDHHEPHEQLPNAVIVNPKLKLNSYPFTEICATTVVYKFLEALSAKCPELSESWLKWQLDLVALATVCDIVPLIDENRVLAFFGIMVMKKSRNCGIQALAKVSGVDLKNINSYEIGFMLGPRINAPGRMLANPEDVFRLLTTDDYSQAEEIATVLNGYNIERQDSLITAVKQAERQIEDGGLINNSVIILHSTNWGMGLVGLIAARIMEKYYRPVFCFREENDIYKGSARSLPGYELPLLIPKVNKLIDRWGGHNFAAGLSVKKNQFAQFCVELIALFDSLSNNILGKVIQIDSSVNVNEVTNKLIDSLEKLQPHGFGNSRPIFYFGDVELAGVRKMGSDGKHLRGVVKQNGREVAFVGFGMSDMVGMEKIGAGLEIAATLRKNCWMGNSTIQIEIKDIRKKVKYNE